MLKILETSPGEKRESFKNLIIKLLKKTGITIHQEKIQTKPPIIDMTGRKFIGGDKTVVRIDFSREAVSKQLKNFSSYIKSMKLNQGVYIPFYKKICKPSFLVPPNVYMIDGERLRQLMDRFLIKISSREAERMVQNLSRGKQPTRKPKLVCCRGQLNWLVMAVKNRRNKRMYLVDVETGNITVKPASPKKRDRLV